MCLRAVKLKHDLFEVFILFSLLINPIHDQGFLMSVGKHELVKHEILGEHQFKKST